MIFVILQIALVNMNALSTSAMQAAIQSSVSTVASFLGVTSKFFRPPFGGIEARQISALGALGMTAVMWDIDAQTRPGPDPTQKLLSSFKAQLAQGGSLVLIDFLYNNDTSEFPGMVAAAKAAGRRFVSMSECVSGVAPTVGFAASSADSGSSSKFITY